MRRHFRHLRTMIEAVLRSPGATDPRLRQAIEARTAEISGRPPAGPAEVEIPAELAPLVDKIARHAHQVTEEDLDALRRAGYSDDALFEITVSGALGAGQARLHRGLAALREEQRGEES